MSAMGGKQTSSEEPAFKTDPPPVALDTFPQSACVPGMDQALPVSTIAHLIQLSIAPVFLLAGIAGLLNVLTSRLARVVDRGRSLERDFVSFDEATRERASEELLIIIRRMRIVNLAITACTASALFVCLVVAILFVADLAQIAFARPIAVLFIVAMTLLIVGLTLFLAEIRLAARFVSIRHDLLPLPGRSTGE
jgi:Protein of unknown function (DUF2721)